MRNVVDVPPPPPPRSSSSDALEAAAELFKALSAPVRLAVLEQLRAGPACVHEIVEALGVPQPLVSQHLRVLRAADLVRGTRRGRETSYEIADEHVAHLVADAVTHVAEPSPRAPVLTVPEHEEHTA